MITYASVSATSGVVEKLIRGGFYIEPFTGNANPLSALINASFLPAVNPGAVIVVEIGRAHV